MTDDNEVMEFIEQPIPHSFDEPQKYVTGDVIGPREKVQRDLAAGVKTFSFDLSYPRSLTDTVADLSNLYAWTTENIKEYLPELNVRGKRCLTVASSGDHIINLLMAGAKEIVAFDSVAAAGEVAYFKVQALADLEWKDKEHFRGYLWEQALTPIVFARLEDRVSDPAYSQGRSVLRSALTNLKSPESVFKPYQTSGRNAYIASEEQFEAAKIACKQAMQDGRVSFVHADVRDLPLLDLGQFDVIVLSNILQSHWKSMISPFVISRDADHWVGRERLSFSPKRLRSLIDMMVWPVARMLAKGGIMMASYTYACPDEAWEAVLREEADENDPFIPDPLESGALRREVFTPPDGFTVSERAWEVVNSESSGSDVGVFVRRNL